jgi:ribosomal protein S20
MKSNYQSALERIKSASSVEALRKLDKSLVRLWEVGIFTESEFSRLDSRLLDRITAMED